MAVRNPGDPHGFRRAHKLVKAAADTGGKVAVSAIPIVGPALATIWADLDLIAVTKRLERLLEELHAAVGRVDQQKVDWGYVASETFQDVLIAATDAARRASDREKLRLLASIVAGATRWDKPQQIDAEGLLVAVRDLPPAALRLAWKIDEAAGAGSFAILEPYHPPSDLPDGDFLMARLIAAGFARAFEGGGMSFQHQGYQLTSTWQRLVELVRQGGWEVPAR